MTAVSCRSCGSSTLTTFLSLGRTPVANTLLTPAELESLQHRDEPTFPLDVALCEQCGLVQLVEGLPAEVMFHADYPYFSSFSPLLLEHAAAHARSLIHARSLGEDSLVVEVASNDGYLLRTFVEHGVPVLGIDPAPSQARVAEEQGVPTLVEFFGLDVARRVREEHGPADVIIANNVMAHVPALNDFVAGMAHLLADDGVITIENPYVRDMVQACEFDTIYHEHFCYYSCTAVSHLMRRHGLWLNHVEYFPSLHGGTLRWHVGKHAAVSRAAQGYLDAEAACGLLTPAFYADFAHRVEQVRVDLRALLSRLRVQGARVAGYGAAAKGSTLANYVGLGTDLVEYVVDRNTHKQGHFMPGTHQPIRPVEVLLEDRPGYVLLLAWNFRDEITAQQAAYVEGGGRFIVPVPEPTIQQPDGTWADSASAARLSAHP